MEEPRSLPPIASFVLTKHVPCAALALVLLSAMIWLPLLFGAVPMLALLFSFIAMTLHMLTPALFALIFMGGGMRYTLQVSALVSFAVIALSGFDVLLGLVVGLFYCILPALAAYSLRLIGGVSRSATQLALGMFVAVMLALLIASQSQGLSLQALVEHLLTPMFDVMQQGANASQFDAKGLEQTKLLLVWLMPGLMAFSLWLVWWSNVLLARKVAMRYGFYTGDTGTLLSIRFGKPIGYALMLSLIVANVGAGSVQYIAASLAFMLAGALSVQGIAVAHVWLKARGMNMVIAMMYVLLFIWFMMVIPFIVLGLLDIWFDYRRNENPTLGG